MAAPLTDDMLVPGDTIRFDFLELAANQTIREIAVAKIKDTISSDDRLDYQGSEWTEPVDLETGQAYRMLSVYAKVRTYRRGMRPETQEASIGGIAVAVLVGAVVGAATAWAMNFSYKDYAIVRITENPNLTSAEKQTAIGAIQQTGGVAGAIKTAGIGGIVLGAGILALLFMHASGKSFGSERAD